MDNRDNYGYGWNEKGKRFHALKSGKRQGRVNMRDCRRNYSPCNSRMIAAYCNGKLFAPFTVEGACNRNVFETWLESCLLPLLKPGQIVIADNATFHIRTSKKNGAGLKPIDLSVGSTRDRTFACPIFSDNISSRGSYSRIN